MALIQRSRKSLRDYGEIWDYLAEHAGPTVADALLRRFDQKLQLLSEFPGTGRGRPELRPGMRSFPVGQYVLYFRPIPGGIALVRVLHGRRDHRRIFRQRRGE